MSGQTPGLAGRQQDHLGDHPGHLGRHRAHGHRDCGLHHPEGEEDEQNEVIKHM